MSTYTQKTAILRSIIRWSTGTIVTAVMIGGCVGLFPALSGSFAAMSLTCFFSGFIGLKIALPPICPEDDWVSIGNHKHRDPEVEASRAAVRPASASDSIKSALKRPHPPLEVLPVHRDRAGLSPVNSILVQHYLRKWRHKETDSWHLLHHPARQKRKSKKLSHN
jgi:hypothetical protein